MFQPQTTKKLLDSLNICSTIMFIISNSEQENIFRTAEYLREGDFNTVST